MIHPLWRCLAILSFLAPVAHGAPLNLRETMRFAVAHSPRLDTAQKEAYLATLTRKNAFAAFLPTIDFSSTLGRRGYIPGTPEYITTPEGTQIFQSPNPWTSSLSVSANENLFDNFQTIDRYKIAKIKEEQASLQALETRDQAFLEIAQAFYQLALDRKLLDIQEDQFNILKRQFGIVGEGYRQGLKTRKDYLRFRSEMNRSEIDLRRARSTVTLSREALLRLLGTDPADSANLDFDREEKEPVLKPLAPLPIEATRQYRITQFDVESQGVEARISGRRLWPELSLTAGATYNANEFVGPNTLPFRDTDTLIWNAGLTLSYNILDWGVRRREAEAARVQESIAANNRNDTLLRNREDIAKLNVDYTQLSDNFRLSRELLDLENKNLESITTEYRQGRVDYLDYITSLKDLASARTQYYQTLYDLKKSQLSYRYQQGSLYEAIFNE